MKALEGQLVELGLKANQSELAGQHAGAGLYHRGALVHALGRFVATLLLNGRAG